MIEILDHGYIKLIEHWGSDERIVESARMSTDGAFRGWGRRCKHCELPREARKPGELCTARCEGPHEFVRGDEKLLAYLWNNKHATPFEMCGLTIEVKAPIFIFRQWHRHRTQSYNEMSARYTLIPNEHYLPSVERLMMSGGENKQAQGEGSLSEFDAHEFTLRLQDSYHDAGEEYQRALSEGVPKELARLLMPVGRYSKMRASANLRNWLGFLTLRMEDHAQWEIRQYANAVGELVAEHFPRTWSLFSG